MGLFDFLKKKTTPVGDTGNPPTTNPIVNFDKMIERALSEYLLLSSYIYSLKANDSKVFTEEILMFSTEQKTLFITDAIRQIHKFFKGRPSYSSSDKDYQLNIVRDTFFRHLFRGKMDLNEAQIIDIYAAMSSMGRYSHSTSIMQWPIMQLVGIIEKNTIDGPLSVNIVSLLKDLHSRLEKDTDIYIVKERVKLYDKINAMLFKVSAAPASVPPSWFIEDTFGTYANEQINSVGEDDRQIWFGLIDICKKATGAKPAKKNLEAGTALLKTLGSDKFKKTVNLWIDFLNKLKEKEHSSVHTYGGREYTNVYYEFISAPNCDTLKGFIWLCVNFHDKATLFNIASYQITLVDRRANSSKGAWLGRRRARPWGHEGSPALPRYGGRRRALVPAAEGEPGDRLPWRRGSAGPAWAWGPVGLALARRLPTAKHATHRADRRIRRGVPAVHDRP